jgi:hypothetical protein
MYRTLVMRAGRKPGADVADCEDSAEERSNGSGMSCCCEKGPSVVAEEVFSVRIDHSMP